MIIINRYYLLVGVVDRFKMVPGGGGGGEENPKRLNSLRNLSYSTRGNIVALSLLTEALIFKR